MSTKPADTTVAPKRYHGKPCVQCGGTERYVSCNLCVECARERSAKWKRDNPERDKAHCLAWRSANTEKKSTSRSAWRAANPGVEHSAHLKRTFGITGADYSRMLKEQGGVCAICSNACKTGRRLAVDHDHSTGKVRALLCANCNRGIGYLQDSPGLLAEAGRYLLLHKSGRSPEDVDRSDPRAGHDWPDSR